MDHSNPEILKEPVEPGPTADSESFCFEKEQRRCSSCMGAEDQTTDGSWSQRSISRSLQRAETLIRSTFNPSLKWLFHARSEDEEEEEGNFVVAHNLASRSSARLLRLQQALLTVASQWQRVGGAQTGSPQICVRAVPAEGGVLLLPSSFPQGNYRALWRLLQQRSLLLFIHEYTRRARITAAYVSRVSHLLGEHLKKLHLTLSTPSSCSSFTVGLSSLSQELRVHLNHWSYLYSKVQSDPYLRLAVVQQTRLLVEVKQTLDSLGLQALVLMEHYVYVVLSAIAQTDLESVPREVLEDILAGTDLYNQAVWEREQHSSTQLRTAVLQQAYCSTADSGFLNSRGRHPAAFSVKELLRILALHHGDMAAKQLHRWASEQSCHVCQVHTNHRAFAGSDSFVSQGPRASCGTSALGAEWTWERLQRTYLESCPLFSINHHPFCCSCPETPLVYPPAPHLHRTKLKNHHPVFSEFSFVQQEAKGSNKDQTSPCQTYTSQNRLAQTGAEASVTVHPDLERQTSSENCRPPSGTSHQLSALPLSRLCQQDHSSVEPLFQLLVSFNDLLAPLATHPPKTPPEQLTDASSPRRKTDKTSPTAPILKAADSVELNRLRADRSEEQHVKGSQQESTELEITVRPEVCVSSGFRRDGDSEKDKTVGAEGTTAEQDCTGWPHSVQWVDLGQSLVFADLFGHYRTMLWSLCSRALRLQLHMPRSGTAAGSINLVDIHRAFQILRRISQASQSDLVPKECRAMLEGCSLYLLAVTAHAQWDHGACRSLGSALKDKCRTDVRHGTSATPSPERDGSVTMSVTMELFLLLCPPLLSSLCCHLSNNSASGSHSLFPSRLSLQRRTVSLALATVQLSTVWVMSKAYQFLSLWSLNKFLLITQGDLKALRESLEAMVRQTKSLVMNLDGDHPSAPHSHSQLLLRQHLEALDRAASELQTFSSLMLKTFSIDCKRMSGEIFEQTMPSAVHWTPSLRTGFPSSPSEYASLAAQTVIVQVLEGVAPLSDDARVQTLSVTMTAFMEAWMEHILKQRIKFSVQGALQLKQDFDSIRQLILSEKYGLSAELHQRLLSLRVFQQVDSAVLCLLQQPQTKPYLRSRAWEPFTGCCPTNIRRDSTDAVVGSSITNLRCMEGEDLTQTDASAVTTSLPPVDPSTPGEPYLAPSVALDAAQQEWLDLRIHSGSRRWRLPGLQCLSKSEG